MTDLFNAYSSSDIVGIHLLYVSIRSIYTFFFSNYYFLLFTKCHRGCVNALNFNSRGNLIVSGSDDLKVVVTNWITGEQAWSYRTGHCMNIFHVSGYEYNIVF